MRTAFWEAVRTTMAEIWAHKFRSSLTLTGVVLGTFGVVFMITLIDGLKAMVWDGIHSLGFDGVMFIAADNPQDPTERKKLGLSRGLSVRDVAIVGASGSLDAVAALRIKDLIVRAGAEERRARVYGITPSYVTVHDRPIAAGRWFDQGDEIERRRVAVLGFELAEKMFGTDDPLGKQIRVGDTSFRIVGVEGRLGNRQANSGWTRREMNGVLIPLATFRAYLQGGERVNLMTVKTSALDRLEDVKGEVDRAVRRAHHGVGDFEIENVADEMLKAEKEIRTIVRNWTIVLAAISSIALLIGGVGIYSVLKISLVERLYEIGLRKSIGASDTAILTQFLVESTTLSALGGLLGCGLGIVVTRLLSPAFETGLPLSSLGLGLGLGFAVATGVFAGLFPALTAARMTPI
ncbi:MAG: multidrug transporter substrate-binding protein, partial [Deltaproteobacteria bacterium]|nr:multidrug transporter substrate-binding protein [Deltaproteobacteria bacterium]